MENKITDLLISNAQILLGISLLESQIQFQKTKKEFKGDSTLLLFPFLKSTGKSPNEVGQKLGDFLQIEQVIENYSVVGGFLNLEFKANVWLENLKSIISNEHFGIKEPDSKPSIFVEYASPNTNKPLHLGHLRNIFLGDAVASILKANGHKVIKGQIINDRGIHICKSMLAWERFAPLDEKGARETPTSTGIKGDKFVGKYYVEFETQSNIEVNVILSEWQNQNFEGFEDKVIRKVKELQNLLQNKSEEEKATINEKIKELAKANTGILQDAKNMLVRWEGRDPETYLLWETMNGWVYEGFNASYQKMNVSFDKLYYESDTFILGKDIVSEGLKTSVFYRKEDGSVWIDLTNEGLDHKLLLRSNGTSVYMTQDLGTAVDRFKDFPGLQGMVYTVGNEQDYHFKVLFEILNKMNYSWSKSCKHLSYGMVELPKGMGRMKSREGTVVDADDLIDEVIETATENANERGQLDGMTTQEKQALFEMIGLGGLKYYLLKVDPKKKIVFNPKESIELQGNTGPFIQYAYARIQSLLRKAGDFDLADNITFGAFEIDLIKQLNGFPLVVEQAGLELSPALLVNYTYELVKTFNQFYQNVNILVEENALIRNARLCLANEVAKTVKKSMHLLGIEVPNKM